MIPYTLSKNSLTAVIKNRAYTITSSSKNWNAVMEAIKTENSNELECLIHAECAIKSYVSDQKADVDIEIRDNHVYYRGHELHNYVVSEILEFRKNGMPISPLINFIKKLMKNPSKRAVEELYKFLQHKKMPITADGNFLAYKSVRPDYYSHTAGNIMVLKGTVDKNGRIFNGIGEEIEVLRNSVCDDKNNGCASGLHVGSLEYASSFERNNQKLIIVEVNPEDVVSVPVENSCQKLRACKYKITADYSGPLPDYIKPEINSSEPNEVYIDGSGDVDDDLEPIPTPEESEVGKKLYNELNDLFQNVPEEKSADAQINKSVINALIDETKEETRKLAKLAEEKIEELKPAWNSVEEKAKQELLKLIELQKKKSEKMAEQRENLKKKAIDALQIVIDKLKKNE